MKIEDYPLNEIKIKTTWKFISIIIIISAGLLFGWYFYISKETEELITNQKNELLAITDFKANQITYWYRERRSDAVIIRNNLRFKNEIEQYFNDELSEKEVSENYYWLKTFRTMYGYGNVYLFNSTGDKELAVNKINKRVYPLFKNLIDSVHKSKAILFSEFELDSSGNILISLVIPMFRHEEKKNIFVGSIVLEIDPNKYLLPLLDYISMDKGSLENIIFAFNKDSTIKVMKGKASKFEEINIRNYYNETRKILEKDVKKSAIFMGKYHDGVEKLGAIKKVQGTKWFIVTSINLDGVYSQQYKKYLYLLLIVLLLISGIILTFRLYKSKQKTLFYFENYKIINEKQSLLLRFEYLTKYAHDTIYLINDKLEIVEANEKALKTYGYSKEELLKMSIINLRVDKNIKTIEEIIQKIEEEEGNTFETIHCKKDGSLIEVEVSARLFEIEGKKYYQEIIRDITERKEAEKQKDAALEALSVSEKKFKDIFEYAPVGKSLNFLDGSIILNKAFCDILGYSEIELQSMEWDKITHKDDVERDKVIFDSILNKKCSSARWKKRLIHKNGNIVWVDINVTLQCDSSGKPQYMITTIIDITEETNAFEALRRSQERFARAMENIPDVITIFDENLNIIFVNDATTNITGLHVSDFIGKTCEEVLPPAIYNSFIPALKESLYSKKITSIKVSLFFEGTGEKMLEITCIPVFDKNKEILEIIGITHDFTESYKSEMVLRSRDEMLEHEKTKINALLKISSGLYIAEEFKDIGATIFGVLKNLKMGLDINMKLSVYIQEEDKYIVSFLSDDITSEEKKRFQPDYLPISLSEVKYYSKIAIEKRATLVIDDNHSRYSLLIDERQKYLQRSSMIFIPLFNKEELIGLISFSSSPENSITDEYVSFLENIAKHASTALSKLLNEKKRTKVEQEICKLNTELEDRVNVRTSQLEAANKELEAFSYSVSHDLRAPLRHINGYIELLVKKFRTEIPEKGLHYLDNISESAVQMGALIDNLLQFSRTGRAEMVKVESDMNLVLRESLSSLKIDGSENNIEWILDQLPIVSCDYVMLKQVWINLLSNAVKFSRNSEKPMISVGYKEDDKEFIFFVKDNGVGFNMQYAQKLFGVFQRLHSSDEFEGTGIGLANVRRIINRHGGRSWAESEIDQGATFYFSIPK